MGFLRFLQYNNAVPIAISLVLLGAGSAFAASNPDAIIASEATVLSVDNTYIANKDLSIYTPEVQITGVTEDEDNYYVAYDFVTIDIRDYVWQDVKRSERMQISKKELDGGDLGLYVTKRLRDVIANERAYLSQVQEKERKAVTQQTVATTYSGLIGRFLNATTETLPGYTPVIEPRVPDAPQAAAVAVAAGSAQGSAPAVAGAPSPSAGAGGAAQVALQVLGNNPARVALRASYLDLGAVLLDPYGTNVGVHTFLDGVEVSTPNIDTSTTSVRIIEYRATDPAGGVAYVKRIVLVGDAADPGGAISSSGTPVAPPPTTVQTPAPAPAPEPAPTPAPEPAPEPVAQEPAAEPAPASEPAPATPEPAPAAAEPAAASTTPTEAPPSAATSTPAQ